MPILPKARNGIRACPLLLVLLAGPALAGRSQTAGTAAIVGTVRDPQELVIPGAAVVVRNTDTGATQQLRTNDAGLYSALYLRPGRYEVRASREGFATMVRPDVVLAIGETLAIDFSLPLRAAQASVTVTSEAAPEEERTAEIGQIITPRRVQNLPLNGRSWDTLVLLTPAVVEDGGAGGVSFRGISSLYDNNLVDGADNNQAFFSEVRGRSRTPYGYSLDAIEEFKVSTAVYSAEFGRAAGGIVNAITRAGTNQWHGDAFYFIRDDLWLARDPVANASGQPKPTERRQQFGGSLGGPLRPDKLFLFLSYDQQKRNFPAVIVPFSSNFFDPASRGSQAQVCVQTVGLAACQAGLNALQQLMNTTIPRTGDNYLGLAKVGYQVNPRNRISGAVNLLRWDSPNGILTAPVLTRTALANGTDQVRNEFLTFTWSSVITPTVVNEARFQYGRDFEAQSPNAPGPSFLITGAADFGMPNFLPRVAFPNEKRFQWVDNLGWSRGRHQFRAGLDINYVRDRVQQLFQGAGTYTYSGSDALTRFVQDLTTGLRSYTEFDQNIDPITGVGKGFFSTTDYNFYFQDNVQIRRSLTMNLGLRYELQMMPDAVRPNPTVPETSRLNTDTNNLGPRVGFAWTLGRKQRRVLRGGYGLYYGRTQNSTLFSALFQNGNFQRSFRFTPATCGAPTVPNTVFPPPSAAPAFAPIFGTSGPVPSFEFATLADFLAACPTSAAGTVIALDPSFVNPLVHEYDLAYEQELPLGLQVQISYVGSRANRLPVFLDVNLPPPNQTRTYLVLDGNGNPLNPSQVTVPFFVVGGAGSTPLPRPGVGPVMMGKSVVNAWYNALVLDIRRRVPGGFFFDANFTYSKAMDDGEVSGVNGTFGGTVSPLNPFDLRAEYGRSELDIRKRFVLDLDWPMPFGQWTRNMFLKQLVGGWTLSSVGHVQDGRPVSADLNGRPSCTTGLGGLTCGAAAGTGGSVSGRVPFIQRNSLFTSPGLATVDLRLAREFKLSERASFQFLWEAFNLFNRTNAVPSSGIFAVDDRMFDYVRPGGQFGVAGSVNTCSGTVPGFNGCLVLRELPHVAAGDRFLAIRSTSNSLYSARQMQFGAKLRF